MVYFLCGHRGCGKNYLANQISEKLPVEIIDTGPIIREAYQKHNGSSLSLKNWIEYHEQKVGKNFTNEVICRSTHVKPNKDYIVIGYRSIDGIEFFNQYFKNSDFRIYYMDGDLDLFRENYNLRENKNLTKEEYDKIVQIENEMGIEGLREYSLNNPVHGKYFYKTANDDSILDAVLSDIKENSKKRGGIDEDFLGH